ncbi:hypothetical protein ACFL2H_04840, partial [Planctomycetota bacterium]
MRQGNLQISRRPIAESGSVHSAHARSAHTGEDDDSLIITVLHRRWKLLALSAILSLAIGGYAYSTNKIPKSITTGQLIYKPLPPSERTDSMKLSSQTISELIESNECMTKLRQKHNVKVPAKQLRELLDVHASRFSNIIDIEFTWKDGQQGIDIVNDVMQIASELVTKHRRDMLKDWRAHQDVSIAEIDIKIESERQKLNQLQESMNAALSLNGSSSFSQQALAGQLFGLKKDLRDKVSLQKKIEAQIRTLDHEAQAIDRQLREQAVTTKQQLLSERKSLLRTPTTKMNQLEQRLASFLVDNQELPYTLFQLKLEQACDQLLPQTPPSAVIGELERQHKTKLDQIRQLNLDAVTLPEEIDECHDMLDEAKRELATLTGTENYSSAHLEEAQRRFDDLRDNRAKLQTDNDAYRRLEETKFEELAVHTKAAWETTEVFDGRKKVFVLAFASAMIIFALPVFALEHFFPSGDASDHLARSVGVPVIGKGSFVTEYLRHDAIKRHPVNHESLRLLALRIQQSVQGPGAMVLFSGLNHDQTSIPTITFLAECLARREERVLIVDACDKQPKRRGKSDSMQMATERKTLEQISSDASTDSSQQTSGKELVKAESQMPLGLSDFFEQPDVETKDIICSTEIPGVDIIPSGNGAFPGEAFGSRRLMELFDDCRQEYTLILVSGPSTNHPSDLQMLSARA